MGSVLALALLLGVLVPLVRGGSPGRTRAVVDALLAVPLGAALVLALLSRRHPARHALAKALGSAPLLYVSLLYHNLILMAAFSAEVSAWHSRGGIWRDLAELVYLVVVPLGYYLLLCLLFPPRCPHCGRRGLEPFATREVPGESGRVDVLQCDECGARCWRRPGEPWHVDPSPVLTDLAWFDAFAPKLRDLRREMRPH
jgi:hypothetical protein